MVELIFFTPKASPFDPTRNQPFVGAIIASNLFCMILHAFFVRPEAGEATRGYLHGGLFIDFIGQTPVSVPRLLSFDILILLVDFVMLALIVERVKTVGKTATSPTTTAAANPNNDTDTAQSEGQDHDAEERGVIQNNENADELNSLEPDHTSTPSPPLPDIDDDLHDERTTLLADPGEGISARGPRGGHPLDSFSSGQAVIMEMGFLTTIRDQWHYTTTPTRPVGYVPSPETATFLRQRFGLQVGTDGRIVRIDP